MIRKVGLTLFSLLFIFQNIYGQTERIVQGHSTRNYDTLAHYYSMVSWDDSQYDEFTYYKLNDAAVPYPTVVDFMNYRVMFPPNYNPSLEYPMMLFLHGAGESGRGWQGNMDPSDIRYDNNGKNILHGGREYRDAVNRDESHPRSFHGFVVFPQVNGGGTWSLGWDNGVLSRNSEMVIEFVEYAIDRLSVDPDRISITGLSNGASGVWDIATKRPDLFAAALPMSGVGNALEEQSEIMKSVPVWLFQGGLDSNPNQGYAEYWLDSMAAQGSRPRYTLYPNRGHNTWTAAFAEADYFSWILDQDQKDIYVYGVDGNPVLRPGCGLDLGFSPGFSGYQWKLNGTPIVGATNKDFTALLPGTYTVEFQRVNRSLNGVWSESNPIEVIDGVSFSPQLTLEGTAYLPRVFGTVTKLIAPTGYTNYQWYKDGAQIMNPVTNGDNELIIRWNYDPTTGDALVHAGIYTVTVQTLTGCQSAQSNPVEIYFGNNGPIAPSNVILTAVSSTKVNVDWNDNSSDEDAFQIYRGGKVPYSNPTLIATLNSNTTSFIDKDLTPEYEYQYEVVAVNQNGVGSANNMYTQTIKTLQDLTQPYPPASINVLALDETKATISWTAGVDDAGIWSYNLYLDGILLHDSISNNSLELSGLIPYTNYQVTISAVDFSGNESSRSLAQNFRTLYYANGIEYSIYDGTWNNIPDFDALTATTSGVKSSFNISERDNTERFGYKFEGLIDIPVAGDYTFYISSDDGSRLYINGNTVVDNDGLHGPIERSNTYTFTAPGKYPIRVDYFEKTGGDALTVSYKGPDTNNSKVVIPANVLYHPTTPNYTVYYSSSTGALDNLLTWGLNTDGSGASPASFTQDNNLFVISNGNNALQNSWNVTGEYSRIVVSSGHTISIGHNITGVVNLEENSQIDVLTDISSIKFDDVAATSHIVVSTNTVLPASNYGKLTINNNAIVQLQAGVSTIQGDIAISNSAQLIGAIDNTSTLSIHGNLVINNSAYTLNQDNRFGLYFFGKQNHILELPVYDPEFFSIALAADDILTVDSSNNLNAMISVGTLKGGGIFTETNSLINWAGVDLEVAYGGVINPYVDFGVFTLNNNKLTIASNSGIKSFISAEESNNILEELNVNLTNGSSLEIINDLKVNDLLHVDGGEFVIRDNVVLTSGPNHQAYIDKLLNGAQVIGDIQIEKYIPKGKQWRYFASPVKDQTVADLQNNIPVSGNFTGSNNGEGNIPLNAGPSLYSYHESNGIEDLAWAAYPSGAETNMEPIVTGAGYAAYFRNDVDSMNLKFTGEIVQGTFSYNYLSPNPTPSLIVPNEGWSLIGNPYVSPIKWDLTPGFGWVANQVGTTIYVRDNENGVWLWYDSETTTGSPISGGGNWDGTLSIGQAFFVQATEMNPSLSINEDAKVPSSITGTILRENGEKSLIRAQVASATRSDAAYIFPDEKYSTSYESGVDALKKNNDELNIYFLSTDSVNLSINKLAVNQCSQAVPLRFSSQNELNLEIKLELESNLYDLVLLDNNTGESISIEKDYSFNVVLNDDQKGKLIDNFELLLSYNVDWQAESIESNLDCSSKIYRSYLEGIFNGWAVRGHVDELIVSVSDVADGTGSIEMIMNFNELETGEYQVEYVAYRPGCERVVSLGSEWFQVNQDSLSITLSEESLIANHSGIDWFINGEFYQHSIDSLLNPEKEGVYQYAITASGCVTYSEEFEYLVSGLDTPSEEVIIYPNPVTESLFVSFDTDRNVTGTEYQIIGVNGSIVKGYSILAKDGYIYTAGLPAGFYYLELSNPSFHHVLRFIKK